MATAHSSDALTLAPGGGTPSVTTLATFLATRAQRRECLSCGVHTYEAAACRNCGGSTAPIEPPAYGHPAHAARGAHAPPA